MKNYVIIGNGVAAAGCIEGIRSIDRETPITVVSEEKYPVYCRPLISYYLEGKTDRDKMNYRNASFYEDNLCTVLYGKKCVKIDSAEKQVILSDGSVLPYSALTIAAGSSPFVPAFEGLESVPKKVSFMTMDDALALESMIDENSRVLIAGAGLIGLKCAEGIAERVKNVTVFDMADRILSSILDKECAALMQEKLEEKGVCFCLNDTVSRFLCNTAELKSGTKLEFDVLVLAVGVRANTGLAKEAGACVNRGILVDEKMATSVPDVFAAGDCTEGMDISSGTNKVLAIMPNAYMQGHAAGVNMAGGSAVFDNAIPMNAIGFFGLHALSAGTPEGEMLEEKTSEGLKRFFVKDGLLKGFMLIGDTGRAGIFTSLIRERTPISEIDFELLKKTATSAAFSKEIRGKKFGGVV